MKKIIYIIFFIVLGFLLNISFYYFSSSYRDFLKLLEGEQSIISNSDKVYIAYDVNIEDIEKKQKNDTIVQKKDVNNKLDNTIKDAKDKVKRLDEDKIQVWTWVQESKVEYKTDREELKITKIEEEILKLFSSYKLKELELHPRLFDLTSEYPDKYFEYYVEGLNVYFFGNKPYYEIKDVFSVLTYELPFNIKEVNNFWDKSFYINLSESFVDDNTRFIMQYKNRTFGFKVKKDIYPDLRDKLNKISWKVESLK